MRKATKTAALTLGIIAEIAGLEHTAIMKYCSAAPAPNA